jgi:hypothetical protein
MLHLPFHIAILLFLCSWQGFSVRLRKQKSSIGATPLHRNGTPLGAPIHTADISKGLQLRQEISCSQQVTCACCDLYCSFTAWPKRVRPYLLSKASGAARNAQLDRSGRLRRLCRRATLACLIWARITSSHTPAAASSIINLYIVSPASIPIQSAVSHPALTRFARE